jgi:hypothetical protein
MKVVEVPFEIVPSTTVGSTIETWIILGRFMGALMP